MCRAILCYDSIAVLSFPSLYDTPLQALIPPCRYLILPYRHLILPRILEGMFFEV